MKVLLIASLLLFSVAGVSQAQVSGNVAYSQAGGRARAEQKEKANRTASKDEKPPGNTAMFIEASVLMNVKADEYVAVFALAQEGTTVAECNTKLDATIAEFSAALKKLGISDDDLFVDFIAQNKVYDYRVTENIAKEYLAGFEIKKNISIHYQDKLLIDKLLLAASASKIFDLVKVDYIVKDTQPIQDKLMEEAARIIKQKAVRREKLLGVKSQSPPQFYAEKYSMHFPTALYDSYVAHESEKIQDPSYQQKYLIQGTRKTHTFYFNTLDADGFDRVINPVVIEPVVQCTLYVKVKYETDAGKPEAKK